MTKTLTMSYLPNMGESSWKPAGTPYLRMRGQWLRAAGFEIGKQVTVSIEQGKLTLTTQETQL